MKLAQLTAGNLATATGVLTLVVYFAAALGATYLVMHLVKTIVRVHLPDHYRKVLGLVHWALVAGASVGGFYLGGVNVALAAVFGSAGSALLHDWLDGHRAWKRLAILEEKTRHDLED